MDGKRSKKPGIAPVPPQFLTVRELSDYLRVHPTTIYRLLRAKQLPGFRVGSEWRFDIDVIERWQSEAELQPIASTPGRHSAKRKGRKPSR